MAPTQGGVSSRSVLELVLSGEKGGWGEMICSRWGVARGSRLLGVGCL